MTILRGQGKPNAPPPRLQLGAAERPIALPVAPKGGTTNRALIKLLAPDLDSATSPIRTKSGPASRQPLIELEASEA